MNFKIGCIEFHYQATERAMQCPCPDNESLEISTSLIYLNFVSHLPQ